MRSLRLALVLLAAAAPAASAQTPDRGLFGIAPAKVLLETRPPRDVRPLQITNTTRLTYDVRIFAAPLRQAADGGLAYDPSAEARRLGRRSLRLGETRYTMPPNSRRDLPVRWLRAFPGERIAPMGIVVQGTPRGVEGGSLGSDYRLVATYLLRLPGGTRDGVFESLEAEQGEGKSLAFTALVRNTGEVYDEPKQGRVTVTDARGREVARKGFKGETILPGKSRPFTVSTRKLLPAGRYTATATMLFGGGKRRIATRFELVGPNELPTTKFEVVDLQASGYVGDPAHAVARVRNSGTVAAPVTVRLELSGPARGRAEAERRLEPGQEATVELDLGELRDGDHRVKATALAGRSELDSATITITSRPERTFWSRLTRWFSDNAVLVIALLALLVIAAIAESTRRYRRRLRAQAQARAAVGAPDEDRKLDLNTASVAQLSQVPGIGPKAAQRIVDWRDEYGRFTSPGDLLQVEGFDRDRIMALGRYLTL